jgi:hypothetical protein
MVVCVLQIDVDLAADGKLPALWSAEEPHLYILVLTLLGAGGEHLDSESAQVWPSAALLLKRLLGCNRGSWNLVSMYGIHEVYQGERLPATLLISLARACNTSRHTHRATV